MRRQYARPRLEELEPRTLMSISVGPIVTPTTTVPEAEEHVAVFPSNPTHLVSVISDYSMGPAIGRLTKYAYSIDGGSNWQEGFVPTSDGEVVTGDGQTWEDNFDPSVAIDNQGRVYLLNGDKHYTGSDANGIYVSIGTVGAKGLEFTTANVLPVFTDLSPNARAQEDKPWIAVDTSQSAYQGNVYATWTHLFRSPFGPQSVIGFARSTDYGETWSAPIEISPFALGTQVRASQVTVGPDGAVYVAYSMQTGRGMPSADYQVLAKSVDGGQTFNTPHDINGRFIPVDFAIPDYRTNSLPAIAVSPSGTVDVVYPQWNPNSATYEIGIIQSTDGGETFSAYHVLNDSTAGYEFEPAVAVDASTGIIWVSWLDTRNSPTDPLYYDIYAADSWDGGQTFSANVRVTPQSDHAVIVGPTGFLGDYAAIAAGGGAAHAVWTSGGAGEFGGNGQLQTATLTDTGAAGITARDLVMSALPAGTNALFPSGGVHDGADVYPPGSPPPDSGGLVTGVSQGGAKSAQETHPLPGLGRRQGRALPFSVVESEPDAIQDFRGRKSEMDPFGFRTSKPLS
jgi:hypothetical protein